MLFTKNYTKVFRYSIVRSIRRKSGLNLWKEDINSDIRKAIEIHWKNVTKKSCPCKNDRKQFYVLSMFPYPSGKLHLGHVRVYSISDTLARFHRLNGEDVLHPMGWDAFGLPAENAAVERGLNPKDWTDENIKTMKLQLDRMGFNFDWERELKTCSPDYYKWTQYIFLKMFENGLVYRKKSMVNWDPVDKTVLADEQVDDNGVSWRSGAHVEQKMLNQWFVRTTKFAKQLYDGLDSESLEEWKDIINLQKHWISECDGVTLRFQLTEKTSYGVDTLEIWSDEPAKFLHADFLVISSENILTEGYKNHSKLPFKASNPVTGKNLDIFVSDNIEFPSGRDIYLASGLDTEDLKISQQLGVETPGRISENLDNDRNLVVDLAMMKDIGGYPVSSKLRDWLISRQRYWGTPIPIIHCDKCGTVPVPYEELPVRLPELDEKGHRPLSKFNEWLTCKCPQCMGDAIRESDTMDTFVDSAWYFLRYLDPKNSVLPFDPKLVSGGMPVDLYVGGKEHATLHLYYARFMGYFLKSIGWLESGEPFQRLLVQGMVMGKAYRLKNGGRYIRPDDVIKENDKLYDSHTKEPVEERWEKMSKSRYNGVDPEDVLDKLGCDVTRLVMLADVPPTGSRHWSEETFPGILNWQHRLWLTVREFIERRSDPAFSNVDTNSEHFQKQEAKLKESRNYFTATATFNIKYAQLLSVAISRMIGLTNTLRRCPAEVVARSPEYELALSSLITMLAPFAPHFASELWSGVQSAGGRINLQHRLVDWDKGVLEQRWPTVDVDAKLSFLCKVDGTDRCTLQVTPEELESLTPESSLQLMMEQQSISNRVNKLQGVSYVKFEKYPSCRVILHLYTNKHRDAQIKNSTKTDKLTATKNR